MDAYKMLETFRENFRKFRKERGWTQTELAKLIGVVPAHVGHIERGDRHPGMFLLFKIAEVFGIRVGELFIPSSSTVGPNKERILLMLRDRSEEDLAVARVVLSALFSKEDQKEGQP